MRLFIFLSVLFASILSQAATSALESTLDLDSDRNWWFSGFSLSAMDGQDLQDGGARFTMYNYASANYRVGELQHISLRLPFLYQSAGYEDFSENENQKQEINLTDVLFDYTRSATRLPGDIEVYTQLRAELPTSESSRAQRKIGGIVTHLIFSGNLTSRLELEYEPKFSWNIHTQTVYQNPDLNNALVHTKRYELEHKFNLWYRATSKISFGGFMGGEDVWFNSSKVNATSRERDGRLAEHLLKLGPQFKYTLNDHFDFIFSISNSVPMWGYTAERTGQSSDLGRFRPEQTEFALLTFISI